MHLVFEFLLRDGIPGLVKSLPALSVASLFGRFLCALVLLVDLVPAMVFLFSFGGGKREWRWKGKRECGGEEEEGEGRSFLFM